VPKPSAKVSDPIDQQLSSLSRGTDLERSAAVTELARMVEKDSGRIILALIGAAADREALVRCAGVDSLHVVKPSDPAAPEAMSALSQARRDPAPRVGARAAGVLSTFRPAPEGAIPALLEAVVPDAAAPSRAAVPDLPAGAAAAARDSIDRNQRDHARA